LAQAAIHGQQSATDRWEAGSGMNARTIGRQRKRMANSPGVYAC